MPSHKWDLEPNREERPSNPNAFHFQGLSKVLTMAGWTVAFECLDNGEADLCVRSRGSGRTKMMSGEVFAEELGLRGEDGRIIEGYSVSGAGFGLELTYIGRPDQKFNDITSKMTDLALPPS